MQSFLPIFVLSARICIVLYELGDQFQRRILGATFKPADQIVYGSPTPAAWQPRICSLFDKLGDHLSLSFHHYTGRVCLRVRVRRPHRFRLEHSDLCHVPPAWCQHQVHGIVIDNPHQVVHDSQTPTVYNCGIRSQFHKLRDYRHRCFAAMPVESGKQFVRHSDSLVVVHVVRAAFFHGVEHREDWREYPLPCGLSCHSKGHRH